MRLVMTLLVRDEEDIVGANIDFHFSRGVDHIIAMDNLSEDGTAEILRRHAQSGRLTYIDQPQDDYAQGVWVSEMAGRAYAEQQADWVIHADADEFWWPEAGDLKTVLAAVPDGIEAVSVERTNFPPPPDLTPPDPTPADGGGARFASAMTLREARSLNALGQPLPPKICHRGRPGVTVGQGNHQALHQGRPLAAGSAALTILHFPVRTYAQFANKIAKGGAAYARNLVLPQEIGATWRRLHARQREGALRASFDTLVVDAAMAAEGLASGALVRDERLRDALAALETARS